ncbi:transcription factor TFIIIC subunit tfc4 [Coemansia sp. Benny D115]|nr:transcription factor TFIIIC subunit tfc4 [Coemansia sp. Benny D115]
MAMSNTREYSELHYLSNEEGSDYDGNPTGDAPDLDEAELLVAVRSAAEMLAAEGLENMVDIHSMHRVRDNVYEQSEYGFTMNPLDDESDYSDEDDIDEDVPLSESILPGIKGLDIEPTPGRSQRATRFSGSQPTDYSENDALDYMDDNILKDIGMDDFMDDNEESDYEDSEFSVSSDDDEYHMRDFEESVRMAAGFNTQRKKKHNKNTATGKTKLSQKINSLKTKKKKKAAVTLPKYSHEVQRLLGLANQRYVEHDLFQAFNIFCDIIRLDPNCAPAWYTMALIREEEGKHSDALQLYTVSAHLNPKDNALWERLYSMQMGIAAENENAANAGVIAAKAKYAEATKQALYCISKVTSNDPTNKSAWMRRLEIHEKRHDFNAMARAYHSMIRRDPYDMETIRMASVHFAKKMGNLDAPVKWFSNAFEFYNKQAIELAEDAVRQHRRAEKRNKKKGRRDQSSDEDEGDCSDDDGELDQGEDDYDPEWAEHFIAHPTQTVPMEELGGYSYSDLNMVAELRILRHEYELAIFDIKRGARFIQCRGRETQWEDEEDTDNMDQEYAYDPNNPSASINDIPIELRVKLGQCRLALGNTDAAQLHINALYTYNIVEYEDLYSDVAETYSEIGNMEMALAIYQLMMTQEQTNQPVTWEKISKCYKEMGDLTSAREYAEAVVNADSEDIDMRLFLGEIYEEMGDVDLAYAMIQEVEDIQQRERLEQEATAAANMSLIGQMNPADQPLSPVEILEMPTSVVAVKQRMPSANTLRRRRDAEADHRRYVMGIRNAEIAFKKLDLLRPLVEEGKDMDALREYCATAQRLFSDWRHMPSFSTTNRKPFVAYRHRLMAELENGIRDGNLDAIIEAMATLTSANMYKFLRRQLIELDESYYKDKETHDLPLDPNQPLLGDLPDDSTEVVAVAKRFRKTDRGLTKSDISALHSAAAHTMTVSRTQLTSLGQYSMALAMTPQDASVALHLGVSYLAHSLKRRINNRQYMVVRGLTFIQRYAELQYIAEAKARGEYKGAVELSKSDGPLDVVVTQEIAYNFARAFHFLGLLDLAMRHYQKVFVLPVSCLAAGVGDEDESFMCDLRREAAYNLATIYISSGAVGRARELIIKYCVI